MLLDFYGLHLYFQATNKGLDKIGIKCSDTGFGSWES